jgi:hypothetical protein
MIDNFGVTDTWEHGRDAEIVEGYPKTKIIERISELPEAELVLLAPPDGRQVQGVTALPDFEHPSGDTIYITGQNNVQMAESPFLNGRDYQTVFIPSEKHELFALVAAACTLYDRRAKQWVK